MSPPFRQHRQHIQRLIDSALAAVDPASSVVENLHIDGSHLRVGGVEHSMSQGRIFLVGAGKASLSMGAAVVRVLAGSIYRGVLITKDTGADITVPGSSGGLPESIEIFCASHPVSDQRGVDATSAMIEMLAQTSIGDLVLCLISGGTSALLTQPRISLSDWGQVNNSLLSSGCTINELNTVRSQLDTIKRGGLLSYIAPATCITLILSDVVGNPLEVIGSGPTVPRYDDPSFARKILDRYAPTLNLSGDVWRMLDVVLANKETEEPVEHAPVENVIIGDVRGAAEAAIGAAQHLGFTTQLLTCHLEGEAREVGRIAAALAKDAPRGSCLVLGGETTVTVRGDGNGGRNQELALASAIAIDGLENVTIASFSTDGEDGPTSSSGAFVTGDTLSKARQIGLDPHEFLARNDSNSFFEHVGGLLNTGPTGTNVNDLLFILRY